MSGGEVASFLIIPRFYGLNPFFKKFFFLFLKGIKHLELINYNMSSFHEEKNTTGLKTHWSNQSTQNY